MSWTTKRVAGSWDDGREGGPKRISSSGGSFFRNAGVGAAGAAGAADAGARGGMELEVGSGGRRLETRRKSHVEMLEVQSGPGGLRQTAFVETDVVDSTREIYSVTLSAVTRDRLISLFTRLDTDGSGSLEVGDFEPESSAGGEANAAVWRWIQSFFSDGGRSQAQISLSGFVQGWKDRLWAEVLEATKTTPWEPGPYASLAELAARLNDSFEETAAARLDEIEQTLCSTLYPTLRHDDSRFGADYKALLGSEDVDYLFVITMTDEVLRDVRALWAAFDTADDLRIERADLERTMGADADAKWVQLATQFDSDADGAIHHDELVAGLKRLAMREPVADERRIASGTITEWLRWMRETANAHIDALCRDLVEQGYAGKGALDRVRKEQEAEDVAAAVHGRLVAQVLLTDETWRLLEQLWQAMDKTGEGTISPRDFYLDGSAAEKWQEIAAHFDEDGDGEVSWDEFTRGFVTFARGMSDRIVFPLAGATFAECVQHLEDTVNACVVALCEQFYERFKHDE